MKNVLTPKTGRRPWRSHNEHSQIKITYARFQWCCITLFISITMLCATDNTPIYFHTSHNMGNILEYYVEYCQSHITLLRIWIMLYGFGYGLGLRCSLPTNRWWISPLCVSSRYLEGHVVPYWTIFWGTLRDKIWQQQSRAHSACKINLVDKYTWQNEIPSLPQECHVSYMYWAYRLNHKLVHTKPCWQQAIARTNERTPVASNLS